MVVLEDGQDVLPLEGDTKPLPDVRFDSVWVRSSQVGGCRGNELEDWFFVEE